MVRALIAALLSAVLPLAALTAPLVHAHVDDHHADHHDSPVIHSHAAPHDAGRDPSTGSGSPRAQSTGEGPRRNPASSDAARTCTVRDDDSENAISLPVYVAVPTSSTDLPDVADDALDIAGPTERAAHVPVAVVHGHDPPSLQSLSSRAPPSFLS